MPKKEHIGIVASAKTNKTIIVLVQNRYNHLKYKKQVIRTKRYMVHDKNNECKSGDLVIIQESRPFSRHKKWILKELVSIYKK